MFGRSKKPGKGVELLTKEVQARRRHVQTALEDLLETPDGDESRPIHRIFASFQGEFPQPNLVDGR